MVFGAAAASVMIVLIFWFVCYLPYSVGDGVKAS